jgi:transcriptional regulator with XRE-family HTH domain
MTNIRKALSAKLKKFRRARGRSQAVLAEKTVASCQYIGMFETKGKFPSSEMIQKPASALPIDPTELFNKEIDPVTSIKTPKKRYLGTLARL